MTRLEFLTKVFACFILPVVIYEYFANDIHSYFLSNQNLYAIFFSGFVGIVYFLLFRLIYLKNKNIDSSEYLFTKPTWDSKLMNRMLGGVVIGCFFFVLVALTTMLIPLLLVFFLIVQLVYKEIAHNHAYALSGILMFLSTILAPIQLERLANDQVFTKPGVKHVYILENFFAFDESYQPIVGKHDETKVVLKKPIFIIENQIMQGKLKSYHFESIGNDCDDCKFPNGSGLRYVKIHYVPSGSVFHVQKTYKKAKHGVLWLGLYLFDDNYVLLSNEVGDQFLEREYELETIINGYNDQLEESDPFSSEISKIFYEKSLTMQVCTEEFINNKPKRILGHAESQKSAFLEIRLLTFFREFNLINDVEILETSNFGTNMNSNNIDCAKVNFKKPEPLYLLYFYGKGWNIHPKKVNENELSNFHRFDYGKFSKYTYRQLSEYQR